MMPSCSRPNHDLVHAAGHDTATADIVCEHAHHQIITVGNMAEYSRREDHIHVEIIAQLELYRMQARCLLAEIASRADQRTLKMRSGHIKSPGSAARSSRHPSARAACRRSRPACPTWSMTTPHRGHIFL